MPLPATFPVLPPMPPLADRLSLAHMVERLCGVIARVGVPAGVITMPLMLLVLDRLQRLRHRFDALLVKYRAGTLHPQRPRAPRPAASDPESACPDPARPESARPESARPKSVRRESAHPAAARLPSQFGWLQTSFQWLSAQACRSSLVALLQDPEMLALLEAAPDQAGRLLRPLCHMLGITPPAAIVLPPRPRRPRRRKPPVAAAMPAPDAFEEPLPPSASPDLVARWRLANPIVRVRPRAKRFDITRLSALKR